MFSPLFGHHFEILTGSHKKKKKSNILIVKPPRAANLLERFCHETYGPGWTLGWPWPPPAPPLWKWQAAKYQRIRVLECVSELLVSSDQHDCCCLCCVSLFCFFFADMYVNIQSEKPNIREEFGVDFKTIVFGEAFLNVKDFPGSWALEMVNKTFHNFLKRGRCFDLRRPTTQG